jgi:hypothetical protein
MRRSLSTLLIGAALCLAACSKCGKAVTPGSGSVERVLPRGAAVVMVVPDVGALGDRLRGLEGLKVAGFSAQLQGFTDAHQWADALVQQLGVDVRSKEALEKAGVDPSRSAGVAATLDGTVFVALPLKDEAKLAAALALLAKQRLGAGVAEEKKQADVVVHSFTTAAGAEPQLGYVIAEGFALVGGGDTVPKLSTWARLPENESLAKDPTWAAQLGRLPGKRDLMMYLPPGSPVLKGPISSAAATLSLAPDGLTVTVDAPWTGDPKALAVLVKQQGTQLFGWLASDAFAVAQFSGDPALLAPWADVLMGPYLTKAFAEGGFDLQSEVLANLVPGVVAGLALAPTAKMGGMPALDLRSTNPFTYAHLTGAAKVKDGAKSTAALEKLTTVAPRFGAQIVKQEKNGHPLYFTTYSAGEGVHLLPIDSNILFGSPATRLEEMLAAGGKGAGPVTDAAMKAALDASAFSMVVDLQKLAAAVRELPSGAWGVGGFAIKATTVRWLDATDDLKAVVFGVDAKGGAVQAKLVLSLKPATAAPAPVVAP